MLGNIDFRNKYAFAREHGNHSFHDEPVQGLSHGCPADIHFPAQIGFRPDRTGRDDEGDYFLLEERIGLVCQAEQFRRQISR